MTTPTSTRCKTGAQPQIRLQNAARIASDRVCLRELQLQAIIGVYPHERLHRQRLTLDLAMELDIRSSATSLVLAQTVDYAKIARDLRLLLQGAQFHLLETAAEAIAAFILAPSPEYARPQSVQVTIAKPSALDNAATPSVTILRNRDDFEFNRLGINDALLVFESADARITVEGPVAGAGETTPASGSSGPELSPFEEHREILVPLSDPGQIPTRHLRIRRKDAPQFLTMPTQLYDFREAIGDHHISPKNRTPEQNI